MTPEPQDPIDTTFAIIGLIAGVVLTYLLTFNVLIYAPYTNFQAPRRACKSMGRV
jgi:hypothetical protein